MRRHLITLAALSLLGACGPTNTAATRTTATVTVTESTEAAAPPPAEAGLLRLLPDPATLTGLTPAGTPDEAVGQDLFRLINGGAELYLEHGFERALAQDYQGPEGVRFSLEVFQMATAENAQTIYAHKGGTGSAAEPIGTASTFEGYYGLFREDRVYFTVTASRARGELQAPIEQLARAVVEKIRAAAAAAK